MSAKFKIVKQMLSNKEDIFLNWACSKKNKAVLSRVVYHYSLTYKTQKFGMTYMEG